MELSLDDSVTLALENNSIIKIAELDKKDAVFVVNGAKANFGPKLVYTQTDTRSLNAPYTTIMPVVYAPFWTISPNFTFSTIYDNRMILNLPLYTGGKLESQLDQAKVNLKITDLEVRKIKQQLKLNTTILYFNALQSRDLLRVCQDVVDDLVNHLQNVRDQYAAGVVAKFDILRSEVEVADAQQDLIKAKKQYDLAIANLNNVMGLPLNNQVKLKENLEYSKDVLSLDACEKYALTSRPEITQSQASIDSAKDEVKVAKSEYLPQINFNGTNDWHDNDFIGLKNSNWSISLSVSVNIFDSGLTKSKVQRSENSVCKAQEKAKQAIDLTALEVHKAYLSIEEAQARIETSKVTVNKAEEDLKIAEDRYSAGVGLNLDVIDAQLALTKAKTNYIQAVYDFNVSKANLEKAMGIDVK
jgi:outer membrane protein